MWAWSSVPVLKMKEFSLKSRHESGEVAPAFPIGVALVEGANTKSRIIQSHAAHGETPDESLGVLPIYALRRKHLEAGRDWPISVFHPTGMEFSVRSLGPA